MLDPDLELADLHIHVGGAVAPHILWSIAHEQGFKLPVKTYWEFGELVTAKPGEGLDRSTTTSRSCTTGRRRFSRRRRRSSARSTRSSARSSARARVAHRAALQPDEAQPRRRARPRPHHPRGAARHGSRRASSTACAPASSSAWRASSSYELNEIIVKKAIKYRRAAWSASTSPGPRCTRSSWATEVSRLPRSLRARARRRPRDDGPHRRDARTPAPRACWRWSRS